jgi:predicted glycosyltransferase
MTKSALMYCCRSENQTGHLRRAMEVARKLGDTFDVTLLVGDAATSDIDVADNVELVFLPALGIDPDNNVIDIGRSQELRERLISRRDAMIRVFERLKPRVVVIENFPFEQHGLRGEVLPLVERARNGVYGDSLVVCMTEGILAKCNKENESRADRAADLLDRYFDIVVVQSDPVFARIEEFFQPKNTLHTPLYHTGFVTREDRELPISSDAQLDTILVTAGDGEYGGALYRAAIDAHKILGPTLPLPMKIIAGKLLPEDEWQELLTLADGVSDLILERSVTDLRAEMAMARWSVSQCGYNTAVRAIDTRTPSLFVPCGNGQRHVQIVRAQRLVYWGAGRLLMPHHLNGASLANEIQQLTKFEPRRVYFDMNGATNAAHLISQVVYHNDYSSVSARPSSDTTRPH